MSIYSSLSKLSRIKLPSGTTYALVDADGRSLITSTYTSAGSYLIGDYVIYNDDLYRCTGDTTGNWDSTKWQPITVAGELKAIKAAISGGIKFVGYTTTSLKEGSSTNPIIINGVSYTVESGDLVIETPPAYAISTAYTAGEYVTYSNVFYQISADITAAENTDWAKVVKKVVSNEPEFIFDGTYWNELGALNPQGLGSLAFKDTASGSYIKPTGVGSVSINTYTENKQKLSTTTIVGTNGTINASEVSGGSEKNQWKQDIDNPTFVYGTADVDTAVTYGNANTGTPVTGIAQVDAQKTFTTAWSASNTNGAITASVDGDCLTLGTPATGTVYGVKDATGVSITPAEASNTQLTPAKAADSSRTAINLVADGTLRGSYTITPRTPAAVASTSTTVATGGLEAGNQIVTGITAGTTSVEVTVGTTTDSVTVS